MLVTSGLVWKDSFTPNRVRSNQQGRKNFKEDNMKGLSANEAFEMIYENGEASHLICKECGSHVERGIVNVSTHWCNCSGKAFKQGLLGVMLETGKVTLNDVERLKKEML